MTIEKINPKENTSVERNNRRERVRTYTHKIGQIEGTEFEVRNKIKHLRNFNKCKLTQYP